MKNIQKLNIIDENEKIIGKETRNNIHKKALLHKEIHVWFFTSKGEIIFQRRGKNKDTHPNLLDATVGGHVEIKESYQNSSLREMKEETGITVNIDDLCLITKIRNEAYDSITDMTNNVILAIFAYRYDDKIEDLEIENEESTGFEAWPIEKIINIAEKDKKHFIPAILENKFIKIFYKIQKLI